MGAFAALGVGLLGTAAGRAAGTLAMGGTKKAVPLSKLEQLAQNELVQSQTFGSNASGLGDLSQSLLQQLAGPGSGASQVVTDASIGFDRAGTNNRITALQAALQDFDPTGGAAVTNQFNKNKVELAALQGQLSSANAKFGTANQRVITAEERAALAKEKRDRANLENERDQIAQRQSNFRQQIRGGNQSTITSLSRKTLLGNQLND